LGRMALWSVSKYPLRRNALAFKQGGTAGYLVPVTLLTDVTGAFYMHL